jgi:NAD(P)-dependent dehydrogenase (short-subunit alcohol dehydrogenase family)
MASGETVIVTGASQGIGAAIVQAFLERGYNVVATSRNISKAGTAPSAKLALVDGDVGLPETAEAVHSRSTRPRIFMHSSPLTLMGSSSSLNLRCGRCWRRARAAA